MRNSASVGLVQLGFDSIQRRFSDCSLLGWLTGSKGGY